MWYLKEVFQRIAEEHESMIDTIEIMEGHVHVFGEAPPRYSPAQVGQILKNVSPREVLKRFPELRKRLPVGGGAMNTLSRV